MKASLIIDYYLKNKIFDINDENVNRDNYAYSIWLLKQKLKNENIDLSTCDINLPTESQIAICFDLPSESVRLGEGNTYLVLFESEVIKPKCWDEKHHQNFKKIFTWHDELVDNKKYFKINFAHKFPEDKVKYRSRINSFEDKKLCTLISGNKKVSHELELYSERVNIIRWFEKNSLDGFDLYGIGWDRVVSKNKYIRFISKKITFINKILAPSFPSYKGKVDSKLETFTKYKFAICYENAQMIPGYITEKIFDCFFAGCVPVYWGAPNITDHIPGDCFIDRRKFKSHEELYSYLNTMTEKQYLSMQKNIENYLFSEKVKPYRADTFVNTIFEHIMIDLKSNNQISVLN
jgi:hypothetical protein